MHKVKVIIWGTGKYGEIGYKSIKKTLCDVTKIVDTSKEKIGQEWNGKIIEDPGCIECADYDWLLIAVKYYSAIIDLDIVKANKEKIIRFYDDDLSCYDWIDDSYLKNEKQKMNDENQQSRIENEKYELQRGELKILTSESCLDKILQEKMSMVRYGDGEFEMMSNQERPWFQKPDERLAKRLIEIIQKEDDHLIIAIPDEFDSLEKYTDEAARDIRTYMVQSRDNIMKFLDKNKTYYDAYVSRPYLLYRKKDRAKNIFEGWKAIWKDREILIIEGANTRNGIGNDLFSNTKRISRIICPIKNAFDKYDQILDNTCQITKKDTLILISLGPTATVLAYDLYKKGYQAIDIGQIDNEYEWFLCKADRRVHIKGKAVPEIGEQNVIENEIPEQYKKEIIINLS